ncbi:MAG TPA: type II toxin-antitoxin system VapC family toxin [Longimicrobiaceae bacterium]|nr:type II toxin-antitoxin system VapC family toxin [Longimicrobiaceae bacterium]
MNHVLDACAMLAYLNGETGSDVVEALLVDSAEACYAHSVNLCEVYYDFLRRSDERIAREAVSDLIANGLVERRDLSRHFWQTVGAHKARGRISLADCFCIALAQRLSADLVTSDRREFEPLVPLGMVAVRFIR